MSPWSEALTHAVIELTNRCNLRCAHCASASGAQREGELSVAEWRAVIDDLAALGCEELTLIGGEVFLHPEWLSIARHVNAVGIPLAIITNGLLGARHLEELRALDLLGLGVSLDGATPEAYRATRGVDGFERVWGFIQRFRDEGHAPVVAITAISRMNLDQLDALAALIRPSGVGWQVQFVHNVGSRFDRGQMLSPEEYAATYYKLAAWIREEPRWVGGMDDLGYFSLDPTYHGLDEGWQGCQAGLRVVGIRANGDLLGCLSLGDQFVEGNLKARPLQEIWRDPAAFSRFRQKAARLEGACASCPHAEVCRAGCAAMAFSATGDIHENPYCVRCQECRRLVSDFF